MNGMNQGGQPYKTENITFKRKMKVIGEEGDIEITIIREDKQYYKSRDYRTFFLAHKDTVTKIEEQISKENIENQKKNLKEINKSIKEIEPIQKESEKKFMEFSKKKALENQVNNMKKTLGEKKIQPNIEKNLVNIWNTYKEEERNMFTGEERVKMAKLTAKHK